MLKKNVLLLILLLFPWLSYAVMPLQVDQAFRFSAAVENNHKLVLHWDIAPGYHLYRDKFAFQLAGRNVENVSLPAGIPKQDNILGKYQVYSDRLDLEIPIPEASAQLLALTIKYQGCADSGFCYPPVNKQINLTYLKGALTINSDVSAPPAVTANQDNITDLLAHQNLLIVLLGFFGFGLLLAFTPCVLPMIPILSGIIVGQGKKITTWQAFFLSLTYVLAMAFTYATAGVLAGLAGSYVQAFLQNPWVIGVFSLVFIGLAGSLFGFYELRMPNFLHHHVHHLSNKQTSGTYIGVAVMGCLSTLIVSPCVTAPLIGVLSYISTTGNAVLGGVALFAMGLGAGVPLLIVGTTEGKFLPKSGPWMHVVKSFFGVLLLAAAIWLLQRIVPAAVAMLLWAALFIGVAIYMGVFTKQAISNRAKFWKGISIILFVYGLLLLVGAVLGNDNPWQPLNFRHSDRMKSSLAFQKISNLQDLEAALSLARAQGKPVMLDFYADWCIACKQMDRNTFSNSQVQQQLSEYTLLRADVTANNADDQALEKFYNVIAPPTILFFDSNGLELTEQRIVGEMNAQEFLAHLP